MGSGGLQIDLGDVVGAARLNQKTLFVGTGAQIAGLGTKYPGMLIYCTSTGSGYTINTLYAVKADGSTVVDISNLITFPAPPTVYKALFSENCNATVLTVGLFGGLNGREGLDTTEANHQFCSSLAMTWQKLTGNVSSAAGTGSLTIISRKNAANGAQTITISQGTNGSVQDSTNTDTISINDLMSWKITANTLSNTFTLFSVSSYGV